MKTYDLKEASNVLKMSIRGIRELIKKGKIKASKVGTQYVLTDEAIKEYLEANVVQPKE